MWGALLAAGATLYGGYQMQQGQRETNEQNLAEAERNRQFQASQTSAQQGFQAEMSNTARQREMADLAKAGLNPALAAGNSGASTPSGASGSGSQAQLSNPMQGMGSLMTNALQAANSVGALEQQSAQTDLIKAQTAKSGVDKTVAEKDIPKSDLINRAYKWIQESIDKASKSKSGKRIKGHFNDYNNPRLN